MNGDVKLEDFQLKKTKLKNGVVEVDYTLNVKTTGAVRHPAIHDVVQVPHPDLLTSIDSFHGTLVVSWGLDKDNSEVMNDITASGIDISGKDDLRGVIITGKKKVMSGVVAMNSPRIRFSGSAFGFEQEVETLVDQHVKEVYAALYEGKAAQLQIAFGDGNAEPEAVEGD